VIRTRQWLGWKQIASAQLTKPVPTSLHDDTCLPALIKATLIPAYSAMQLFDFGSKKCNWILKKLSFLKTSVVSEHRTSSFVYSMSRCPHISSFVGFLRHYREVWTTIDSIHVSLQLSNPPANRHYMNHANEDAGTQRQTRSSLSDWWRWMIH
jgi:hypothetical protein